MHGSQAGLGVVQLLLQRRQRLLRGRRTRGGALGLAHRRRTRLLKRRSLLLRRRERRLRHSGALHGVLELLLHVHLRVARVRAR